MASNDDSKESDTKKPDDKKPETDVVPPKAPWWDMSAQRVKVKEILLDAEYYRLDIRLQTLEIVQHKRDLCLLKLNFEARKAEIKADCKKKLKVLERDLEKIQRSVDKLHKRRLKVERIASNNAKAHEKAAEEAKSQQSFPTMSVGPQELLDLGLGDLKTLVEDKLVDLAIEDDEAHEIYTTTLIRDVAVQASRPRISSSLAPVRKWMNPKQKVKQLRKRFLATSGQRQHKRVIIERTSPRIEMKKKKLAAMKSTRQHSRLHRTEMLFGPKFFYRLANEVYHWHISPPRAMLGYFVRKAYWKRWNGAIPADYVRDWDYMMRDLGEYTAALKWPWKT
ncbi:uncharacterized protein GGS22DRAFT_189263 [Annulohypoxylon maeteangense]|uniref:uncharacterized protein n=1 Tax=Annulohypoxylon maeteangense TaxID=1927788 RepID=UPI002007A7AF|nr:uncharacterized protein GGS22DRAFT_189263 [Annulohypoxylon maeteangense]KAI0884133.1 hypothetical protein GGS22DRAFT_189263 [Annulohypoxylon maeteangense]